MILSSDIVSQAFGLDLYQELPPVSLVELMLHGQQQHAPSGYLSLARHALSIQVPPQKGDDGAVFLYDEVKRGSLDAAVIAPYFEFESQFWVVLRSAVRPPIELREQAFRSSEEPRDGRRGLWELPAGLVDVTLMTMEEPQAAAQRELYEETGFELAVSDLKSLGVPGYPCPGVIAEKQYFYRADLTGQTRAPMPLDGSPLESVGKVIGVPLKTALLALESGLLQDLKTEVGLTRLARFLGV